MWSRLIAAAPSNTFSAILSKHGGAGPGFDLLRLGLAIVILLGHCSWISGTHGFLSSVLKRLVQSISFHHDPIAALQAAVPTVAMVQDNLNGGIIGFARPFTLSHVPMFFALSGFLVTGSALRTRRVLPFLGLRFLRIFPALLVEVTLSAIILGAILTALPLKDYYSAQTFWTYFGNIAGIVQVILPGVTFAGSNVKHIVNANLWTLPAEFHSYLLAAALIVGGVFLNRVAFSIVFVVATIALLILNSFLGFQDTSGLLPGEVNVYYFFSGALLYLWRDKIVYSVPLFLACVILTYFLMFSTRTVYVYPLLLTYVTVFIGLTAFPKSRLLQSGDYSYGIYLYGFPISQALVVGVPALRSNLAGLSIAAVLATGLCAFLSWHLVEARFLRLRKYLSPQSAKIAKELHPEPFKLEAQPLARQTNVL